MDLEKQVEQLEKQLQDAKAQATRVNSELESTKGALNSVKQELADVNQQLESLIERDPCIKKALLNPLLPVFTMLGTDKAAPQAIETWAWMADNLGSPATKCTHARQRANEFRNWQADNADNVKIPD